MLTMRACDRVCILCRRFKSIAVIASIGLGLVTMPHGALAYRPFDGTDAAVAERDKVEIEFQPIGSLRENAGTSLIAPATVINIGFADRWEAVFEGKGVLPLSPS